MNFKDGIFRISESVSETANKIPFKEVEEVGAGSYGAVMGTLLLMLALFYLGVFLFKKYDLARFFRFQHFANEKQAIEIIGTKAISQRTRLTIIKYKGKELLIAEHTNGVTLLDSQEHTDVNENHED